MNNFAYVPRILTITLTLALAACELPTKLGNLSATDSGSSGTTGDPTATDGESSVGTTGGTTDAPEEPWQTATTMFDPSETTLVETSTTGMAIPPECVELGEADCEAYGCQAYHGKALEFPGCSEGLVFLGCSEPQECEHNSTIFCEDGTDAIYDLVDTGCAPAGFTACEAPALVYCDTCESLSEAECLDEPSECRAIYGAPHVEVDGDLCADYGNQDFLGCIANGGACPPFIPVVCKVGEPDKAWDAPSGCILQGFEDCSPPDWVPGCM